MSRPLYRPIACKNWFILRVCSKISNYCYKMFFLYSKNARFPGGKRPLWILLDTNDDSILFISSEKDFRKKIKLLNLHDFSMLKFKDLLESFQQELILPEEWN